MFALMLFQPKFCPSDKTNSIKIQNQFLQGKVYIQSNNIEARENIAISLLHSDSLNYI